MKIDITNTQDASYEWEPTDADETRAAALFGQPLGSISSLSLADLCRLLFPNVSDALTGGQQLVLLSPPMFKGRLAVVIDAPTPSRPAPGRIVYGGQG